MRFTIPIRLPSLNNARLHWRRMDTLKRKQKDAVKMCLVNHINSTGERIPPVPLVVLITRAGPRRLDDDNLAGACKYVRDQIAREVGVDDGSNLYEWRYAQKVSKTYGVEVEITPRPVA